MIHDVDSSIRALIRRDVANGDIEVAFDAPTREWAAKRSTPTIDVFLFDIREDVARRRVEPEPVHDDVGVVVGRRRPPRRYKLSYLITAWTQRPEDEHRLLSAVLGTFLHHEELPREVLEGAVASLSLPILTMIGLPPPPERSIGEIWSAMGGELKPSLELVLSVPFELAELRHAGPPVLEEPRFEFEDGAGRHDLPPATRRRRPLGPPPPRQSAGDGEVDGVGEGDERVDGEIEERIEERVNGGRGGSGRVFTITTKRR